MTAGAAAARADTSPPGWRIRRRGRSEDLPGLVEEHLMPRRLRAGIRRLPAEAGDPRQEQATPQPEPSDAGREGSQDQADGLGPLPFPDEFVRQRGLPPERGLQVVADASAARLVATRGVQQNAALLQRAEQHEFLRGRVPHQGLPSTIRSGRAMRRPFIVATPQPGTP